MHLLLLNEIKQEAISPTSCSMPETWQYSTVEVRSPSLYSFVATKCGNQLDTVMTQCKLGLLLIRSFAGTKCCHDSGLKLQA